MGLRPTDWINITHRDYVNICVGYFNKKRSEEFLSRKMWYAIVQGWADPKKLPPIEKAWPINGEKIPKPKKITVDDVKLAAMAMKNFGRNKIVN